MIDPEANPADSVDAEAGASGEFNMPLQSVVAADPTGSQIQMAVIGGTVSIVN